MRFNGVTLLVALAAACLIVFLVRLSARAHRRGKRIKGHSRTPWVDNPKLRVNRIADLGNPLYDRTPVTETDITEGDRDAG